LDKDGTRIHAEIAGCEASIQDTMEELEGLDADLPPRWKTGPPHRI